MNRTLFFILCLFCAASAAAQVDSLILPEPPTLDLPTLIGEAIERNPTIRAAEKEMHAMDATVLQAGALDPPELSYMREEMPGFQWDEARITRLELMQMIRFPSKRSMERTIAEVRADHAHHEYLQVVNDNIAKISTMYFDLWFVQQQIVLERDNARLLKEIAQISGARYAAGIVPQYDVLKAQMELAMLQNTLVSLRAKECSAKEMLMTLLNRPRADTLGFAVISDTIPEILPVDSLEHIAQAQQPMLIHDSLSVEEARMVRTLAERQILPDLRLGVEYMTLPLDNMNAWSVKVGITLPFAPWVLGATKARSDEADARLQKAAAIFEATRNMVLSDVRTQYREAVSEREQLSNYQKVIIPQSQQTLGSVQSAYQNGQAEFMMVLESYRTVSTVTVEYFMIRMKFEQARVALERAVGVRLDQLTHEHD